MFDDLPPCSCRLHKSRGDEAEWDSGDRKLVDDVTGHGWHLVNVLSEPGQPPWTFTVGMWHNFRQPELAMFGLRGPDMGRWINQIGEQIRKGDAPEADESRSGILDGADVQFAPADKSWYTDLFGYGSWFSKSWFPVLQVVWPDKEGNWPWDGGAGERCRRDQPNLWIPASDHPLGKWRYGPDGMKWRWPIAATATVFLSKRVLEEKKPIVSVVHQANGDWAFLDGGTATLDELAVVYLGDVVSDHPIVNGLTDLPAGWHAWLGADGEWKQSAIAG